MSDARRKIAERREQLRRFRATDQREWKLRPFGDRVDFEWTKKKEFVSHFSAAPRPPRRRSGR